MLVSMRDRSGICLPRLTIRGGGTKARSLSLAQEVLNNLAVVTYGGHQQVLVGYYSFLLVNYGKRWSWYGVFEVWQVVEVVHDGADRFDVAEFVVDIKEVPCHGSGYAVADSFAYRDWAEAFCHGIFDGVADTGRGSDPGDDQGVNAVGSQELVQEGAREGRGTLFGDDQFAWFRGNAGVDVRCAGRSIQSFQWNLLRP